MPDKRDFALVARQKNFVLSAPATRTTLLLLVLFFYALALAVQLPGNVPYDGITVWHEAETRDLYAQHPPTLVLIWYLAELVVRGPALFTALQLLALWTAGGVVMAKYRTPLWLTLCLCLVLLAWPTLFAFSGVTVKDVFGGHLALLAFVLALPSAGRRQPLAVWFGAFALGVLATLFRYQFGLILIVLTVLLAWDVGHTSSRWKTALGAAVAGTITTYAVVTLSVFALFTHSGTGDVRLSLRKIMIYDIAGVVTNNPAVSLPVLAQAGVDVPRLKAEMRRQYSPLRVDTMWFDNRVEMPYTARKGAFGLLWPVSYPIVAQQWLATVAANPVPLLAHRAQAFKHLLGFGDLYDCRPIRGGISSLPTPEADAVQAASYAPSLSARAMQSRFFPVGLFFRSWLYLAICLGVIGAGLWGAGVPRQAMLLSAFGLAYEASFFFLPQACEVRYSYAAMLAAVFSLVLIAAGPSRAR